MSGQLNKKYLKRLYLSHEDKYGFVDFLSIRAKIFMGSGMLWYRREAY